MISVTELPQELADKILGVYRQELNFRRIAAKLCHRVSKDEAVCLWSSEYIPGVTKATPHAFFLLGMSLSVNMAELRKSLPRKR